MEKSLKSDNPYGIYFLANYTITLGLSLAALGVGIIGIVLILYDLFFRTGTNPTNVIGTVLALCFGSLLFLEAKNSLLIISSERIEYRRSGYTISADWKDVKKVELRMRRRPEYVLVLKKSDVKANRLNKFLLGMTKSDVIIPLNAFAVNWHRKSIGDLIQQYAPQIKLPT